MVVLEHIAGCSRHNFRCLVRFLLLFVLVSSSDNQIKWQHNSNAPSLLIVEVAFAVNMTFDIFLQIITQPQLESINANLTIHYTYLRHTPKSSCSIMHLIFLVMHRVYWFALSSSRPQNCSGTNRESRLHEFALHNPHPPPVAKPHASLLPGWHQCKHSRRSKGACVNQQRERLEGNDHFSLTNFHAKIPQKQRKAAERCNAPTNH